MSEQVMAGCGPHRLSALRFRFARGPSVEERCLLHAILYPPVVRTAVATSVVVGTILVAINQGNTIVAGDPPGDLVWKVPMTYAVPYSVATFSALRITRAR